MPDPPEDEGLKTVRRDEPPAHLLYGDLARSDQELVIEPRRSSSVSIFAFAGVFLLIVLVAVLFLVFYSERNTEHRQATIDQPVTGQQAPPPSTAPSVARPSATPPSWASGNVVPVFPEMLKVSSIAMGKTPLAIVNGKRVAVGDWLDVKTDHGTATVVVENIDDGVVHCRNGDMTIDAKLPPRFAPKPQP